MLFKFDKNSSLDFHFYTNYTGFFPFELIDVDIWRTIAKELF